MEILKKQYTNLIIYLGLIAILPAINKYFDTHVLKSFHFIDICIFLFFFFFLINRKRLKKYYSYENVILVSFFIFLRISLITSIGGNHHKAFYELAIFFCMVLLFLFFQSKSFIENRKIIIKTFLLIFFTFSLFETILGIEQFIFQKKIGYFFEPNFGFDIKGSASVYMSDSSMRLFKFMNIKSNYLIRSHGSFNHPNIYAGFLVVSLFLNLYMIFKSKKKLFFSSLMLLSFISLIFTFSRAALGSFILVSFIYFILMQKNKYDVKKSLFIFSILILLVSLIFFKQLSQRGFFSKIFQTKESIQADKGSQNTREVLKNISKKMIRKKPILGIGLRNFIIKREDYSNLKKIDRANVHNIYLLIASEGGIASLLLFMMFLSYFIYNVSLNKINSLEVSLFCVVVSFLIIGILDHYPISTYFGRLTMFSSLGILNIKFKKHLSYSQRVYLYQ